MVSSTEGSSISTVWKRRTKALSASKYFWYSSKVVAPIVRSSPRARAGFKILAASIAPLPPPAPMRVWISSMKRMISPLLSVTSRIRPLRRSSNSPLNFAPAINAAMSKVKICLDCKFSGTSFCTMRQAIPSTIAVLPTPASPIKIGLFFLRRDKMCSTRRISSSRPIMGSSLPLSARSLRLTANFFKAL